MSSVLFVEAFGQLFQGADLEGIVSEDAGDLYSVFDARAESMCWSTAFSTRPARRRPLLWHMNEAELTAGIDDSRIGYVQVGLDIGDVERTRAPVPSPSVTGFHYAALGIRRRSVEPAVVLPALVQCFDDALRRFGDVELSALQVSAHSLDPWTNSYPCALISTLNWFNTIPKRRANALIAFDQELLAGQTEEELVASLRRKNTGSFEFGPVVAVHGQYLVRASADVPHVYFITPAHSGLGVSVTMPEWTPSAIAWVIAMVIDTARASAPDVNSLAVRVTRV